MKRLQIAPEGRRFADLLNKALDRGFRGDTTPVAPWDNHQFAAHVRTGERSVRNWRRGKNLPNDLAPIEDALFGRLPDDDPHRIEFRTAYHAAKFGISIDRPAPTALRVGNVASIGSNRFPAPGLCLGREKEITRIVEALVSESGPHTALILGGPGIGKTTVTLAAGAHPEVVKRFSRRWFVRLDNAQDARGFDTAISAALGLPASAPQFAAVLSVLENAPGLLVLDNLETPWEPEEERLRIERRLGQLSAVPGIAILASMRGRETVYGVQWALQEAIPELDNVSSEALLRSIAPNVFNGIVESDSSGTDNVSDLQHLLKRLGGVPQAIVLVALRAAPWKRAADILKELDRVGTALAQRRGVEVSRLTSLEVSIRSSLESCRMRDRPDAQRLIKLLGQLPAGISRDDLFTLNKVFFGGDQQPSRLNAAFEAATDLLAVGLAFEDEHRGRIDLRPPIREFIRRQEPPKSDDLIRVYDHYLTFGMSWGPQIGTSTGASAWDRLAPEMPNIQVALRHAIDRAMWLHTEIDRACDNPKEQTKRKSALKELLREATAAAWATHRLMAFTGADPREFHRLAELCEAADDVQAAAALNWSVGAIALSRAEHDKAESAYEKALTLYRTLHSVAGNEPKAAIQAVRGQLRCLLGLGDVSKERSQYTDALAKYDYVLNEYRRLHVKEDHRDDEGEAHCLERLGDIALRQSKPDKAQDAYTQALGLYQELNDSLGEANCRRRIAEIERRRWEPRLAEEHFAYASRLYRQARDFRGEAYCIRGMADIHRRTPSEPQRAKEGYEKALQIFREVGAISEQIRCLLGLAEIAREKAEYEESEHYCKVSLKISQRIRHLRGEADAYKALGHIYFAQGHLPEAQFQFEKALNIFKDAGSKRGEAYAIKALANITKRNGDKQLARIGYIRALNLFRESQDYFACYETTQALSKVTTGSERLRHLEAVRKITAAVESQSQKCMRDLFAEAA